MCCGCDTSYIVSVHIQCQTSIYTLSLRRGHSWRVWIAKQETLTPPGHLVSHLVCRGPWMSTVVLCCWCHSYGVSVLLYFTFWLTDTFRGEDVIGSMWKLFFSIKHSTCIPGPTLKTKIFHFTLDLINSKSINNWMDLLIITMLNTRKFFPCLKLYICWFSLVFNYPFRLQVVFAIFRHHIVLSKCVYGWNCLCNPILKCLFFQLNRSFFFCMESICLDKILVIGKSK